MNITNQIVMSSVEICEVLRSNGIAEKEHKNVMRDIDKMMEDIGSNLSTSFEGTYLDSYGREQRCWFLSKDHALCLVSGYSAKIRMAIIDRMNELEQATNKAVEPEITVHTPKSELFLLLARQSKEIEHQQLIIQQKTEDVNVMKETISNRHFDKLLKSSDLSRELSANPAWSVIEGNRRWNWNPSSHDIMNYLRDRDLIFKNGSRVKQTCIDRYGDVIIIEEFELRKTQQVKFNVKFNVHAEGFVLFIKEMKNFMIENKIGLTKSGQLPGIEW